jgi:hypothetical protein
LLINRDGDQLMIDKLVPVVGNAEAECNHKVQATLHPQADFCSRQTMDAINMLSIWMHVDAGVSAEVAIDQIYAAYGRRLSVTKILSAMIKDKPDGHPNLHL